MPELHFQKGSVLVIVLLLVFFGLILAGGYVFKDKIFIAETKPQTTVIIPTPTIDPYTGWTSYSSQRYGFSIKYPQVLQVSDREILMDYGVRQIVMLSQTSPFMEISISTTPVSDDFLLSKLEGKFDKSEIIVDKFPATKYSGLSGAVGNVYRELVFFQKGDATYFIKMSMLGNHDLLNKILATFEFPGDKNLDFETIEVRQLSDYAKTIKSPVAINSIDEWEKIIDQPEIHVDFRKETVIAAFLNARIGGYNVNISEISDKVDHVDVVIAETSPGKNCLVTQATEFKNHIVKLPKITKPVKFRTENIMYDCID